MLVVNGAFAIYQYFATLDQYHSTLEMAIMLGMAIVFATGIVFSIVEHLRSWLIGVFKKCC